MVAVFCFQNTIPCVLGLGRVWRYLWSQTRLVVPFLRRLRPESPNAHHRPTGDTTWLGTQSNQIKSIFVILYLFLSTQINITTGYLVLCKQDLFRYNIIRRNRSYKIKIRIKSYISGYCKFNASKIFYPTCFWQLVPSNCTLIREWALKKICFRKW